MLNDLESDTRDAIEGLVSEALDAARGPWPTRGLTGPRPRGTLCLPVGFSGWSTAVNAWDFAHRRARLPHGPTQNHARLYRLEQPLRPFPLYIGWTQNGEVFNRVRAHFGIISGGSRGLRAQLNRLSEREQKTIQLRVGWATGQPPDHPNRLVQNGYELFLVEKLLQLVERPVTWAPSHRTFED